MVVNELAAVALAGIPLASGLGHRTCMDGTGTGRPRRAERRTGLG